MADFITIKEFATRAGVSSQAIYQRLSKDLQSYCKEIDGKKMLDTTALELFASKEVDNDTNNPLDNELIKTLQDTLHILSAQLDTKDRQIAELNERLQEANELNKNNQILIGRQQDQKQIEAEPEPVKKKFFDRFRK